MLEKHHYSQEIEIGWFHRLNNKTPCFINKMEFNFI